MASPHVAPSSESGRLSRARSSRGPDRLEESIVVIPVADARIGSRQGRPGGGSHALAEVAIDCRDSTPPGSAT